MVKPAILLIGGLDPQGCSGLSADLATAQFHGCHGLPLVTAMTEQTVKGMTSLGAVSPTQFITQYHNCVADYQIKAIKIGLIPTVAIARCVQHILQRHDVPVILDPVLGSSSGGVHIDNETRQLLLTQLLTKVTLVTPNLPELGQLLSEWETLDSAADRLRHYGVEACLVKGGHAEGDWATDFFSGEHGHFYLYQKKYRHNVRGTGCVLATSLACQLATGQDLREAVVLAKAYVSRGIRLADKVGPYALVHHSHKRMDIEDIPKLCYHAEMIGQQFHFAACPEELGVYPVVDSNDWVKKLVDEGITTIQLRVKQSSTERITQEIEQALAVIEGKSVHFFVNDHWQKAVQMQVYGVHLGQEDLHDANLKQISDAGLRLGISTHSYWELARALAINPSYIALGPIYATTSKQMPFSPQGKARLREWVRILKGRYAVVAIGGIDLQRAHELKTTGVGSIAMISAITQAADYRQATHEFLALWS